MAAPNLLGGRTAALLPLASGFRTPHDDEIDSWRLKRPALPPIRLRAIPSSASRQRLRAIALMCAATIFFAALDTSAKSLSGVLPAVEIVWARYVAAAIVGIIAVRPLAHPAVFRSNRPVLQIIRSLLLLASTTTNFLALRQLQLAETSTINFLTPMFVVLLAGPLLGGSGSSSSQSASSASSSRQVPERAPSIRWS